MDVLEIEAPLERRIGQDDVEEVLGMPGELVREVAAQGVLIMNIRGVNAMQQQVHGGDAQHGDIEIEAVNQVALDVLQVRFQQVAGVDFLAILLKDPFGRGVLALQELHRLHQEAGGTAGRVAYDFMILQ